MKSPGTSIYFIATIPPPPVQDEVRQFKLIAKNMFQSSHALKSPPHITLIPPFRSNPHQIVKISQTLSEFGLTKFTFPVKLNGFAAFRPRVIYVDVEQNEELIALRNEMISWLDQLELLKLKDQRPFHPHMTIAFKDLTPANFYRAYPYFQHLEFQRGYSLEQIYLLKHIKSRWEIKDAFQIGEQNI